MEYLAIIRAMPRRLQLALGIALPVLAWRDRGALGYLLRRPGAFDAESIGILLRSAVLPGLAAAGLLCVAWALGRRLAVTLGCPRRTTSRNSARSASAWGRWERPACSWACSGS